MSKENRSSSLKVSKIGIFSALYVVTSLIPISIFIGAPSFLALNLIITPTMAIILSPIEALMASLIGGLISIYVAPSQAMFGIFSILLPIAGATFGSLLFNKGKIGCLLAGGFLVLSITAYLIKNYSFPYFVLPHIAALGIVSISILRSMTPLKVKIPLYTFASTMCEQGMMMIFAVHLLNLPWQVFPGILPLMLYERLVGTIGASIVYFSLKKTIPKYLT